MYSIHAALNQIYTDMLTVATNDEVAFSVMKATIEWFRWFIFMQHSGVINTM